MKLLRSPAPPVVPVGLSGGAFITQAGSLGPVGLNAWVFPLQVRDALQRIMDTVRGFPLQDVR